MSFQSVHLNTSNVNQLVKLEATSGINTLGFNCCLYKTKPKLNKSFPTDNCEEAIYVLSLIIIRKRIARDGFTSGKSTRHNGQTPARGGRGGGPSAATGGTSPEVRLTVQSPLWKNDSEV